MARPLSADALDVIAAGGRYTERLTITHPDGEPVVVEVSPGWSVREKAPIAGPRLGISSLQLLSNPDEIDDLFAFAGRPDAIYRMSIGISLGSTIEWTEVFTGHVIEGSSRRNTLGVQVSLSDGWAWADRVALAAEYVTVPNTARAAAIIDLMTPPAVEVETVVESVGGYIATAGVYTGSRGQAAAKLAADGLLQVGFNGSGALVLRAGHDLTVDTLTPDWYFRSDQSDTLPVGAAPPFPATIVAGSLERTRPWAASLFNAVTVKPAGSEQTWAAQTVSLQDTDDPRHEDKIGFRPIEITSDTISNACEAWRLAEAKLTRLLRATETSEAVKLEVVLNPAIEADDVAWVAALPTLDDSGWNNTLILTSVTHSPSQGKTLLEGISALGYLLDTRSA